MRMYKVCDLDFLSSCHSVVCVCNLGWYCFCIDPSISVSISGDVDEAKAFRSGSSQEQSGKTISV